ncbi:uncharacterized protein PRCAT00003212001 [Priceomyces carsonii]|uniref:uncharacterized protein n=1 Tax=Priceomyces carsonii TaxID=28549 RepID=UPI002EDA1316|nr:unnamed protein product [Priceomyces carsonii]
MGQILSQPVTEKHSSKDEDKYSSYGFSCMQGWRINMEDAHALILNVFDKKDEDGKDSDNEEEKKSGEPKEHVAFFGVYDGHGGEKAAIFAGEHLHDLITSTKAFQKGDYTNALKEGFLSCDQAILQDYDMREDDSGCAATSALIIPSQVFCGNAGDSRTILSTNGFAKALSYDHKPSNEGEKARICSAGGYVDMGRVNGNLALSRGIGDFEFKKNMELPAEEQIVTCYPDVIQHDLNYEKDEFVVLACDGIWDCLTSQNCVECIRRGIYERKELTQICEELMELCCAPTSDGSGIGCDNMSIVIVALLDTSINETLNQWYDKIIKKIEISQEDPSNKEYGTISNPYNEIYKDIYGEYYEMGQQSQGSRSTNSPSMFRGLSGMRNGPDSGKFGNEDEGDVEEGDGPEEGEPEDSSSRAISLQKLLASNAITNENGVIYLDTSSAQSLLAHFGMSGADGDDLNEEDEGVHDRHIEEEIEDNNEEIEDTSKDDEEESSSEKSKDKDSN